MTTRIRIGPNLIDKLCDLVGVTPIRVRPTAPLIAINWSKITLVIRPLIPNPDSVILEVLDVGIALQKPKQLMDNGTQVQFFGRQYRKAILLIKPHLLSKTANGARFSAVLSQRSMGKQVFK